MITLRPYQNDTISELSKGFGKHKGQILCLPTGAGKTVVFANMVYQSAKNGTTTLVLTHRTELFKQTAKAIETYGIQIQLIDPSNKKLDNAALINVAMVETIERRIKKGFDLMPKLIIIDEAHFGNFTKLIKHFSDSWIIGVTATPVGKHFFNYYTNIVETIRLSDLISQGFLCDYKAFQMQDDFSDVKKSKGEFDEKDLYNHFDKSELYNGVIEKWKDKCNGQKTVIFNCNIEHSEKTTQSFNDAGIESYCITSKTTKEERKEILLNFDNGKFLVLNNCGILTTGWDCPDLTCIIVNRATMSLPLWLQMCGRGSRISENKTHFTVLDFGKNHSRHGMWNEDRIWKLTAKKEKTKEDAAPVKTCKECGAMLHISANICPYCETEIIKEKKDLQDGVLVEITKPDYNGKKISQCTEKELLMLELDGKYGARFIWLVLRSRGEQSLRIYSKLKGYKRGWVARQMNENVKTYTDYTVYKTK